MRQEQAHSSGMSAERVDELSPTKKQDYKKMGTAEEETTGK